MYYHKDFPSFQPGQEIDFHGHHGDFTVVAVNHRQNTVVLKRAGYSENPGSRYSGLRHWYSPEMLVLVYAPYTYPNGYESYQGTVQVQWEVTKGGKK